jgi:hypothetical protein
VAVRPGFVGQWVPLDGANPAATGLANRIAALTIVSGPGGLAVTTSVDGVSGLYVEQPRAADGRRFRRDLPGGAGFRINFYDEDPDVMRFEDGSYSANFQRVIFRSFAPNPETPSSAPGR